MNTNDNISLPPSQENSNASFANSTDAKQLETLFAAFDDNDDADKNPDNNELVKAIAKESDSFIPQESKELNGNVYIKDHSTEGSPRRSSSNEKLSKSKTGRLVKMKDRKRDDDDEEEKIEIEIEYEKKRISKRVRSQDGEEEMMMITTKKTMEIEYNNEGDLNPALMNFDFGGEPAEPGFFTKAKDSLLEIGTNGKFLISNKSLSMEEKRKRYKEIIYNYKTDLDIACLVCLDGESFEGDDIFMCDLCNSGFHQSCFGSELLDIVGDVTELGDWFCHRCSYLLEHDLPFTEVRCEFCPEMKGPIKRIKQRYDKHWGHIACVNWIPEIYYEGVEKENVFITQYWKDRSCGRKDLLCCFCGI